MSLTLTPTEYYPSQLVKSPWNRKLLSLDFLESDKLRIDKANKWHERHYWKADEGANLPETSFFAKEVKLSAGWKASIDRIGDFAYRLLSPIANNHQRSYIMLVQADRLPRDNSYIRITKSKKHILADNPKITKEAIIVEEWEPDEPDKIYLDIQTEKNLVTKLLKETFHEDIPALSFAAPLLGAPKVVGGLGGIASSSVLESSTFSQEFHRILQQMLPPEFRACNPPKSWYKGKQIQLAPGISTIFAERQISSTKQVRTEVSNSLNTLDIDRRSREVFGGELSCISSVTPTGTAFDISEELLRKFTQSEITSFDLDERRESTVLVPLKRSIGVEVMACIVQARNRFPSTFLDIREALQFQKIFTDEWKITLPEIGHKDLHEMPRVKGKQSFDHAIRYAQSRAREKDQNQISMDDLREYKMIMSTNLEHLRENTSVKASILGRRKQKDQERLTAIQVHLESNALCSRELWDTLSESKIFRTREDLQAFLDNLHERGYIIQDNQRRYKWI